MEKLLATIVLALATVSINAQTVPQFNSEDEVYMYAKYNDSLLWTIYNGTKAEVKTSMNFQDRYSTIEAPFKAALESKIKHLEDSLGVSRNDGAGDGVSMKIYNPNADTAKVRVFLTLQNQTDREYYLLISNATKGIQNEFDQLFENALLDAVNRYYQNAQRTAR